MAVRKPMTHEQHRTTALVNAAVAEALTAVRQHHGNDPETQQLLLALRMYSAGESFIVTPGGTELHPSVVELRRLVREHDARLVDVHVFNHFPTLTRNALLGAGISTLAELLQHSARDLMQIRWIGKNGAEDIESWLAPLGLSLGMSADEIDARIPELREAALRRLEETRDPWIR